MLPASEDYFQLVEVKFSLKLKYTIEVPQNKVDVFVDMETYPGSFNWQWQCSVCRFRAVSYTSLQARHTIVKPALLVAKKTANEANFLARDTNA